MPPQRTDIAFAPAAPAGERCLSTVIHLTSILMIVPIRLVCLSLMLVCVAAATADELEPTFVFRGHETRVRSVAFSPDGKLLVSRGNDPPIRLWNVVKGEANG